MVQLFPLPQFKSLRYDSEWAVLHNRSPVEFKYLLCKFKILYRLEEVIIGTLNYYDIRVSYSNIS